MFDILAAAVVIMTPSPAQTVVSETLNLWDKAVPG